MNLSELFSFLDQKAASECRFVIAIDGGAASGKTTLAEILSSRYHGAVIHMDDFFPQHHQRTEERLSEPGGNLDRERFLAEVIPYLHEDKAFFYRRFDCQTMALGALVPIPNTNMLIVEGSYSHHPAFADRYDCKIFLDVAEDIRKKRILVRNGEEKYQMFLSRWIPMENRYFEAFSVKEKADIVIDG